MSILTSTAPSVQNNRSPDFELKAAYYTRKRELFEHKKTKKTFLRHYQEFARFAYQGGISLPAFTRAFRSMHLQKIDGDIREASKQVAEAKAKIAGDSHLFDWSERRTETLRLSSVLRGYDSVKTVKVGGHLRAASEYAHEVAWKLGMCSTVLIRQENLDTGESSLRYREKCNHRWCPLCGHFRARKMALQITDALKEQILRLPQERLIRGRLVHMVLTCKNVPLDQALDIKKAWRFLQHEKKKTFARKKNVHEVWRQLPFGVWKFELTQNGETGLWHPHLHLLTWADGFLAPEKRMIRVTGSGAGHVVTVKQTERLLRKIKRRRGYWYEIQKSWQSACKKYGLVAAMNGSRAIAGAKTQHLQAVLWFNKRDPDKQLSELPEKMKSSVSEIAKYVSKSSIFEDENADDFVTLMASLHGQQLMSGWGGVRLSEEKEEEDAEKEEAGGDDPATVEAVYRYDDKLGRYIPTGYYRWQEHIFGDLVRNLRDTKKRKQILCDYERMRTRVDEGMPWAFVAERRGVD